MTKTKPMTDFNWGKKFTELQEKQGKLGTQKALISRSFIAHAIDQAKAEQREELKVKILDLPQQTMEEDGSHATIELDDVISTLNGEKV